MALQRGSGGWRFDGLLLDADNTLLDFDEAERAALLRTLGLTRRAARRARRAAASEAVELFHAINARLWRSFEAGEIDQRTLRLRRFEQLTRELHLEADPRRLAEAYIANLSREARLRPHALAVLRWLRRRGVRLALVSNGIARVQRARLARLAPHFDVILISEEIGIAKPDRRFFDLAIQRLALPRQRVLCVGDSPSSDIRGGRSAGLATCWYAYPPRPYPPEEPQPDYRIEDLRQLAALIKPAAAAAEPGPRRP